MNSAQQQEVNFTKVPMKTLHGLKRLEKHVDQDTYIYILKSLYGLVLKSCQLKETKRQLLRRIQKFEKDSSLPGFLSSMPIEELLSGLEDAQYLYPISRCEILFPTLH